MMMLFFKGSRVLPTPWILSGIVALALFEFGTPDYLILLASVLTGLIAAVIQTRRAYD